AALARGSLSWACQLPGSPPRPWRAAWPMYRNNGERAGSQVLPSPLADPARVPSLAVRHQFPCDGDKPIGCSPSDRAAPIGGSFVASPIVARIGNRYTGYIGNGKGRVYALGREPRARGGEGRTAG